MNTHTQTTISKLLKHIENYDPATSISENVIEDYSELYNLLQINNPLNCHLSRCLHLNLVKDIIKNKNSKPSTKNDKKRIKFKSKVNPEELDKVINFSLWKNIPMTANLFNVYASKKNNFIKNPINNSNDEEEIPKKKTSSLNYTYKNNKKPIQEEDEDEDSGVQHNTYMNNSYYLKRKNNTNSNVNSNSDYENYSNSIYNVNKKKNNNNNNKNKFPYNNKYKNKKDDEDEEDDEVPKEEVGFKNAVSLVNKKIFKGGNSNYNQRNNDKDNNDREEQINVDNKSGNNARKFNPPFKANNTNNNSNNSNSSNNNITSNKKKLLKKTKEKDREEDKEKELDDKLKGFDKKMIEFVESEILSFCPNVKWEDIAGLEFAKKTIKEIIIWPLLRPDIFNGIRRPPKGLLLFGPPGTGKTMIAKAIASESKSKFFNISASSLMSKWIGESEKLVRTLFALASYHQPSVVFIDEIDSILTSRSENECEASRRLKTEFLIQLDGAGTNQDDRILIIGATNRPQEIDDAFIRRLAKRLYIPLPNFSSRNQLIVNVTNREQEKSQYEITEGDIETIVKKTKGYSGSDLMGVCREAAMMPIRSIDDICNIQIDNLRGVNIKDFIDAIGTVKPSVSEKTIFQYVQWNIEFGSFQFDEKENDN